MRSLMLFLLVPTLLFSALAFETNHQQEVELLKSFDIDSSFLYDKELQQLIREKRKKYKSKRFFQAMEDAYLFIPMMKNLL